MAYAYQKERVVPPSIDHGRMEGDPDGGGRRPGPRRRLTLVPGALSPELSGSRFSVLPEEEDEEWEGDALASEVASEVLSEVRVVSRDDVQRPAMSDSALAQEFWEFEIGRAHV